MRTHTPTANQASTFVVELPPETFQRLGLDGMAAAQAVAALEEVFAWQLDGHRLKMQSKEDGSAPWSTFPTFWCRHWYLDNIAVMGDAAHTTHYSIGFGTKLALEDSITLAGAVAREGEVGAALRRYQHERIRDLRPPVETLASVSAGSSECPATCRSRPTSSPLCSTGAGRPWSRTCHRRPS